MKDHLAHAEKLRASTDIHFNCAQSVFIPFAEDCGLTEEQAFGVSAGFGGGMNMAKTCGACTGALMALGAMGLGSKEVCTRFLKRMKDNHDGTLDCADLLRKNKEAGLPRKPHCDGMVYEAVRLVEEIMKEEGKG